MKPIRNKNRKRYFITGVGNCGTSLVTGALARVIKVAQDSKRFHEHSGVVSLNEDIIAGGQGDPAEWINIPEEKLAYKDPRFRETLDKWVDACEDDDDVYVICCFRTPKYNAASLKITEEELKTEVKKVLKQIEKFCNVDD